MNGASVGETSIAESCGLLNAEDVLPYAIGLKCLEGNARDDEVCCGRLAQCWYQIGIDKPLQPWLPKSMSRRCEWRGKSLMLVIGEMLRCRSW